MENSKFNITSNLINFIHIMHAKVIWAIKPHLGYADTRNI